MQRSDKRKIEPADENTTMGSGNFISISNHCSYLCKCKNIYYRRQDT